MNIKSSRLVLLLLAFSISLSVRAGSPVWRVTNGDHHLFIGGTIHLLSEQDYPLPPAFDEAYDESTVLVFETDVLKMQSPEIQQMILKEVTYTNGRNLRQTLSEETYTALDIHCTERGIPTEYIIKFKPGMAAMVLTIIELQRLGLASTGVDMFFAAKALNDDKEVAQLETIEEQIAFLSSMGIGQEDLMITYTLRDMQGLSATLTQIKESWRQGNTARLNEVALLPLKNNFLELYKSILVNRNNAWLPQIESMLYTDKVEFVLIGALHLVGDDGLLDQLKVRGYEIQML